MNITYRIMEERAKIFDDCVAELSPSAQRDLSRYVDYISNQLGRGAGENSAKELIVQWLIYKSNLPKDKRLELD